MISLYDGYVQLSFGRKKHLIHNEGTSELFRIMSQVLVGESLDLKSLPKYFQVTKGVRPQDASRVTGALYNSILVAKKFEKKLSPYTESEQWTAVFTGTLTQENFKYDIDGNSTYYLVLINGYDYPLATIALDKDSISELQAREQALIQWNLTFANPGDVLSADDNE